MNFSIFSATLFAIVIIQVHQVQQICGNHVLEILILQWENPFSAEFNMECCDENVFYPNCSFVCNTRFEVCLQPFSFPPSTHDCTFGSFEIPFEPSLANPNNISFIPGINLDGNIPNPIQYGILQPVSKGVRMVVSVYDFDFGDCNSDEFIDEIRIAFNSKHLNSDFSLPTKHTGMFGIGTLTVSYRISCLLGYCGSDCDTICSASTSSQMLFPSTGPVESNFACESELHNSLYDVPVIISLLILIIIVLIASFVTIGILLCCSKRAFLSSKTMGIGITNDQIPPSNAIPSFTSTQERPHQLAHNSYQTSCTTLASTHDTHLPPLPPPSHMHGMQSNPSYMSSQQVPINDDDGYMNFM